MKAKWPLLHRRWSRRDSNGSEAHRADTAELSVSEARNNENDSSVDSPQLPSPGSKPGEDTEAMRLAILMNELTAIELKAMTATRALVEKSVKLWNRPIRRHVMTLAVFVCACAFVGWCLQSPETEVRRFLRRLDLECYAPVLLQQGYDRLEDVLWASDEDLKEAGVQLRPHRRRILRKAAAARVEGRPWLLRIATGALIAWLVGCLLLVGGLIVSEGLRRTCKAGSLWLALTLWCRYRIYSQLWTEWTRADKPRADDAAEICPGVA